MTSTVVVAGLCARPLAESARQGGWQVIALDLFGDADTRRASVRWFRIGDPGTLAIEPALLRAALHAAARKPGVIGWIPGSGFEGMPEVLAMEAPRLPLLGMPAAAVRRVRDPAAFFTLLDSLSLDHPEVALDAPAAPEGWLVKCAGGAGGWHIRHAGAAAPGAGCYWQRLQDGEPMSALFLADGLRARLVALNRLIVRPLGPLPFVYAGAIGPIRDDVLERHIEDALAGLVPALALQGLASLDFMAHAGRAWLLEINPRPSGTMVLHGRAWPSGLLRAHVRAMQGELPTAPARHAAGLRGYQAVFADSACRVGPALATELAQSPHCHDLPAPAARFACGEPVCTVSAAGSGPQELLAELNARSTQVLRRLVPCEESIA